jgi:hypothetical protein
MTSERRLEILRELGSTVCGNCGKSKRPKMSHCGTCYYRLPMRMRGALYRGFGDGYEEAYEESLEFLREPKLTSALPAPEKPHPTCRRCPAPIIFAQQNPTKSNPSPSNNPLNAITQEDVVKEGFPEMTPAEFVRFYARHNKCAPDKIITRIEFVHL